MFHDLHHVLGNTPQEYKGSHQIIKEAYRILKDRGVLIVNTASHEQIFSAFFESYLIPIVVKHIIGYKVIINLITSYYVLVIYLYISTNLCSMSSNGRDEFLS